jgi:hypothetical protein
MIGSLHNQTKLTQTIQHRCSGYKSRQRFISIKPSPLVFLLLSTRNTYLYGGGWQQKCPKIVHLHCTEPEFQYRVLKWVRQKWGRVENWALLDYYAASSGKPSPTFRDNLVDSSSHLLRSGSLKSRILHLHGEALLL